MATVYSLVCWGGLSGKTVTSFTDTGDIINVSNHGLRQGVTGIVFSTTGSLPTGIVAGTTYYSRDGADAGKFTIYPTKADALAGTNQITFTGTGSGSHTVKSAYMLGLNSTQLARYGNPGSERIYPSLYGFQTGITTLLSANPAPNDKYICEIGEDFFEVGIGNTAVALPCGSIEVTTKVNGVRSAAWHGGDLTKGYTMIHSAANAAFTFNSYYVTLDGINIKATGNNGTCFATGALCCFIEIKNNIFQGVTTATGQKLCTAGAPGDIHDNIILNAGGNGIHILSYTGLGTKYYNNLVTKCTGFGITTDGNTQVLTYNNLSVGNGTNWGPWPSYIPAPRHSVNFGEPVDKKAIAIDYAVNVNNITLTGHGRTAQMPITFTSSGTLPTVVATGLPLVAGKVYYVKTVVSANVFTIAATPTGTVFAFSNNGSGTHYTTAIWSNDGTEMYLDLTTPNNVFSDYTNNDFRPAGSGGTPNASAVQVEGGMAVFGGVALDMLGNVRPNYKPSTYPNEKWDAGPFEFDHGNGLAPASTALTITAQVSLSGAEVRIYDLDNNPAGTYGTELSGTESHNAATYTYTGSTGNVIGIQIMQSGYEEFTQTITLENPTQSLNITLRPDINA